MSIVIVGSIVCIAVALIFMVVSLKPKNSRFADFQLKNSRNELKKIVSHLKTG